MRSGAHLSPLLRKRLIGMGAPPWELVQDLGSNNARARTTMEAINAQSMAMPAGPEPTPMGIPGVLVEVPIGVTVLSS